MHVIVSGLLTAALSMAGPTLSDPTLPDDAAQNPAVQVQVMPERCTDGLSIPSRPGPCRLTPHRKHRPTVVIWGDSHAWQHIPGLREEARARRVNLVAYVMGACPPMDLSTRVPGACPANADAALDHIKRLRKRGADVRVVIGAHWQLYRGLNARLGQGWQPEPGPELFRAGQAVLFAQGGDRLFRTLGRLRVRTAVIAQVPWVPADRPDCAEGNTPYACDLLRSQAISGEAGVRSWLAIRMRQLPRRSWYVDVTPHLCDLTICRAAVDGVSSYLDDLHLNPELSRQMRRFYGPVMKVRTSR